MQFPNKGLYWQDRHESRNAGVFLSFSGVDRNRVHLLVLLQQALVHCATFEVETGGLQAEEAQVAVDQVGGLVQCFVAVKTDQRGFIGIQMAQGTERGRLRTTLQELPGQSSRLTLLEEEAYTDYAIRVSIPCFIL